MVTSHNAMFASQRRQLTVMFCDLVGSTQLSTALDPEDLHEVIRAYHDAATAVIEAADGFVAKYLGDGVLAYFGYPNAHEDDAERAIYAALKVVEATAQLAAPHGGSAAVRVGIATGLVVVGQVIGAGWAQERSVVGEAPNLAARLQHIAKPNQVVVSNTTRCLADGLFDYRDLGPVLLKGFNLQEPVWQVMGKRDFVDRFEARHATPPAQMVGRDHELGFILETWARREVRGGQAIGIVADAGIGKSRLIYEVHKRIGRDAHLWVEGSCAQLFSNTPFYVVSQLVRHLLDRDGKLAEKKLYNALERSLAAAGVVQSGCPSLIAELIGIPAPPQPLDFGAEAKRNCLVVSLADWLLAAAARWPMVIVVEDLHWLDPSSIEVLNRVIANNAQAAFLLLYTARSGFEPIWPLGPHHRQIALERLQAEDMRRLVTAAADHKLSDDLVQKVLTRADGIPLFAEELVRLMGESNRALDDREIPTTLSDLLMARLDRLGQAKEVAQIAATLGREVPYPLLKAVSGICDDALRAALDALVSQNILDGTTGEPNESYSFKHALIEDAAYGALLKSQRRQLHHKAAVTIVEQFQDLAAERPELVAQHWTNAGEPQFAIAAWQRTAQIATTRRALKEAQAAYERAIAMLMALPADSTRAAREFSLQSALSGVLQITRGYAAPATVAAMTRAQALAGKGGKLSDRLRQSVSEWAAASSAGNYILARDMADHILALARADGKPANFAHACMIQMTSCYRAGDLNAAEDHFSNGKPFFDDPEFHRWPGSTAQTFGNAALIAWLMSDSAEARSRMDLALVTSAATGHPYDLTFAQSMAAVLALLSSAPDEAESFAAQCLARCREHGYPQIEAIARIVLGRARAGRAADDRSLIREGLHRMSEAGSRVALSRYLTWLAETQAINGALDDALDTINQAIEVNPQELFARPECFRVRSEFRVEKGLVAEAEADCKEALALSKRIGSARLYALASQSLERVSANTAKSNS